MQLLSRPRLALPVALKEAFTFGVSPTSCRGGPEELKVRCVGQPAGGFLAEAARDAQLALYAYSTG